MIASLVSWARRRPFEAIAWTAMLAAAAYIVSSPLLTARYPLMSDLPFHAANASVIKNYWDPTWHFREQFVLQPFAVPYMTMYLIAAACMFVMSAVSAIKIAAAVMLALLPAGLAVLCWGMRKSPLLGVAGLPFTWCALTGWGFINFLGAVGLFAMVVGVTLRLLGKPTAQLGSWLSALLVLLFFTHPFRFPFAVCAVIGACVLLYPATRRVAPALWALVVPLAIFALWWLVRPQAMAGQLELGFHPERLASANEYLFRSFYDPTEPLAVRRYALGLAVLFGVVGACAIPRWMRTTRRQWAWRLGTHGVVLSCAAAFLLSYLVLPMRIGPWWFVYPREVTAGAFVGLALLPDLPKASWLRAALVLMMCLAIQPLSSLTLRHHRAFDEHTRDFGRIVEKIPKAPKLMYLLFDLSGSSAVHPPFLHLPAYVQAERGGWLSFHFAVWGASPVVYRTHGVVPPPVPLRWEWTPHKFRVLEHGPFFDWFLIRSQGNPSVRLRADPSIVVVAREGRWWLYRRKR